MDINDVLPADGQIALRLITNKNPKALDLLRHSMRPHHGPGGHAAVRGACNWRSGRRWPTGFYYDFEMKHALWEADFPKIEAEMARIVAKDELFERVEMDRKRPSSSAAIWGNR